MGYCYLGLGMILNLGKLKLRWLGGSSKNYYNKLRILFDQRPFTNLNRMQMPLKKNKTSPGFSCFKRKPTVK